MSDWLSVGYVYGNGEGQYRKIVDKHKYYNELAWVECDIDGNTERSFPQWHFDSTSVFRKWVKEKVK